MVRWCSASSHSVFFVSLKKILGEIEAPHILVMPEMIWPKSQIGMIEPL